MAKREHRGNCPVCKCETLDRIGGEWCPRCLGWVLWEVEHGHPHWTVRRPLT